MMTQLDASFSPEMLYNILEHCIPDYPRMNCVSKEFAAIMQDIVERDLKKNIIFHQIGKHPEIFHKILAHCPSHIKYAVSLVNKQFNQLKRSYDQQFRLPRFFGNIFGPDEWIRNEEIRQAHPIVIVGFNRRYGLTINLPENFGVAALRF